MQLSSNTGILFLSTNGEGKSDSPQFWYPVLLKLILEFILTGTPRTGAINRVIRLMLGRLRKRG